MELGYYRYRGETDIDLGGTLTYDEYIEKSTKLLWTDFAFELLFSIYFNYVIMKWAKTSDGYTKIVSTE